MSSTLHATIRLKISGAVIAPVHSVVVALARYVTELVDSIRRGISTVEERTREKGSVGAVDGVESSSL